MRKKKRSGVKGQIGEYNKPSTMGRNKDTLVHDEFDILQPEAGKKVSDKTIIDIEK